MPPGEVRTRTINMEPSGTDGHRVLVTRYHPRGFASKLYNRWEKALSPSPDLLRLYKDGKITWETFAVSLRLEISNRYEAQVALGRLRSRLRTGNVTLLCYEKDGEPCHRHLLKQMLEDPESGSEAPLPECRD